MSSALSVSASPGFQVSPQPKSSPLVTIFAIQTETVHPTWIITLPNTEAVLTTGFHDMLPTRNLEASTTESIPLSTTDTALPTTSSTSILETLTTSSPTENSPNPTIVGISYSDVSSSMDVPPMPSTSTSISQPPTSVVEETAYTSSSNSPTTVTKNPSPSRPSTSPFIGIVTNASISGGPTPTSSSSRSSSTLSTSSKAGIIAGSTLGGCAIIAVLFAIIFCIRRRRSLAHRTTQHLHKSINPPSQSSRTLPASMSQPSTIPIVRPGRHAYHNPDSSLDSMYLRHERFPKNISQDSIHPPSSAEILPSRIASFYSTSSWDGGHGLEEFWDLERGNLTKHDSMRSNPFDLEPSLNVHPAGSARLG